MFFGRNLWYLVSPWKINFCGAIEGLNFSRRCLTSKNGSKGSLKSVTMENEVKTGYCPPGCAEEWVEIEGSRVRYLRSGHGEPLVLVHGLLGYSFSWLRVIAAFAGIREVFAPDLPGSGFSECRTGLDCRLAAAAHRLGAFMDAGGYLVVRRGRQLLRRRNCAHAGQPAALAFPPVCAGCSGQPMVPHRENENHTIEDSAGEMVVSQSGTASSVPA